MMLNLENKFGGKPEFTPLFVNNLVRTVATAGNQMTIDQLAIYLNEHDHKKLVDKIEFGQKNSFWKLENSSIIVLDLAAPFSENDWTPDRFSKYLIETTLSRRLEDPQNWNSFAALYAWSLSLKAMTNDKAGLRALRLFNRWADFEHIGLSTGLSLRDKDGGGLVINDVQWNVARKWLQAFGCFVQFSGFKSLGPRLLQEQIESVVRETKQDFIPVREVVRKLREKMPFLPGGPYGGMWLSYLKSQWAELDFSSHVEIDQENMLTQQESLAFLTLEAQGRFTLRDINDAGDRFLMSAGSSSDLRPVSHVEVAIGRGE